jgi:hypothetical protein
MVKDGQPAEARTKYAVGLEQRPRFALLSSRLTECRRLLRCGNFLTTLSFVTSAPIRLAVASAEAKGFVPTAMQAQSVVRSRSALSTMLVLLSLLVMVLPSLPQGLRAVGVGALVTSQWPDGLMNQGESPSTGLASRLEIDDGVTPPAFPGSQILGTPSAPTLRDRSALSLGISADAPLHRPPRAGA